MRSSTLALLALASASVFTTGCAIHANERQVGTAAGAVIGGTVGHVLSGGSAIGTVGGAAAGAVIGAEVGAEVGARQSRGGEPRRKPRTRDDD
jgi:osmotically inducible lipoprotein OsmB